MKVVVTGGSGLVGRNLQDVVNENTNFHKQHQFIFLNRSKNNEYSLDCSDRNAVFEYFHKEKFDAIIHLAACVGGLYMNLNNNNIIYDKNKQINDNVLDACHASGVKYGIFCSSSCVFPYCPSKYPMDESMMCESEPHPSNSGYAKSKIDMSLRCQEFNGKHKRKYMCLIPVNMYGKYDNFDLNNGHFIPALMHRFHQNKYQNHHFLAYGDGTPLRQLLYAKDFADIICKVLLKIPTNEISITDKQSCMIICNDHEYQIKELVEQLVQVMNIKYDDVEWDKTKANGCMRKTVTNQYFQEKFPNYSFTDIKDGLEITYEWFCDNYPNI